MNTLARGQKLPIFSGFDLPGGELAAQIAAQAEVRGSGEEFAVGFAAIGIPHHEASVFRRGFETSGALERTVLFMNGADCAITRLVPQGNLSPY